MESLSVFLEKQLQKKVNIFEYKNQKIQENQHVINFNNQNFVVEIIKKQIPEVINGFCYLFYQNNLEYRILYKILCNLFEDINIFEYDNILVLVSSKDLNIDKSILDIVETESYKNTFIMNFGKIECVDDFKYKFDMFKSLFVTIQKDENINKLMSINDLKLYKIIDICDFNYDFFKLMNISKFINLDKNLIKTGLCFIENDLNISKTSNSMYLHRNTLIYRLDKIKEILNLDIRNFKDALIFYVSSKYFLYVKN